LPPTTFLFSIAGISVTLVGFSGLIAALRRESERSAIVVYRQRQIPEMALASALIALIALPLYDSTVSANLTIRILAGFAFVFTAFHVTFLIRRVRRQPFRLNRVTWVAATLIDLSVFGAAIAALVLGNAASFEWLLVALVARPAVAFGLALGDVMPR
jgi:hypothetical protein